jgi:hypothetical protein
LLNTSVGTVVLPGSSTLVSLDACVSRVEAPFRDSSTIRLVRSIVGLYKYEVQYFCYYRPMHSLRVRVLRWTVCPAMVERKLHTFLMVR